MSSFQNFWDFWHFFNFAKPLTAFVMFVFFVFRLSHHGSSLWILHTLQSNTKANHSHLLHEITCNSDINPNLRLNTRKSFRTQCTQLNNTPTADTPNKWAETTWHTRWQANSTHLQKYISTPNKQPPGHDLHRHCCFV